MNFDDIKNTGDSIEFQKVQNLINVIERPFDNLNIITLEEIATLFRSNKMRIIIFESNFWMKPLKMEYKMHFCKIYAPVWR